MENCDPTESRRCDQNGGNLQCAKCLAGHFGSDCSAVVDACQSSPCGAQSTCTNVGGGYACACAPGLWGAQCDRPCTDHNCTGAAVCDQTTGAAIQCSACNDGFFGDNCTQPCDAAGRCAGRVTCHKANGVDVVCERCADGYFGVDCGKPCLSISNCHGLRCDKTTGAAVRCASCDGGFTGATCSQTCPSANCASQSDTICDQDDPSASQCQMCPAGFGRDAEGRCLVCGGGGDDGSDLYCEHGGQCISDTQGTRTCLCTAGYNGDRCETRDGNAPNPGQGGSESGSSSGLTGAGLAIVIIVVILVIGLALVGLFMYSRERQSSGTYAPNSSAGAKAEGVDNLAFDDDGHEMDEADPF